MASRASQCPRSSADSERREDICRELDEGNDRCLYRRVEYSRYSSGERGESVRDNRLLNSSLQQSLRAKKSASLDKKSAHARRYHDKEDRKPKSSQMSSSSLVKALEPRIKSHSKASKQIDVKAAEPLKGSSLLKSLNTASAPLITSSLAAPSMRKESQSIISDSAQKEVSEIETRDSVKTQNQMSITQEVAPPTRLDSGKSDSTKAIQTHFRPLKPISIDSNQNLSILQSEYALNRKKAPFHSSLTASLCRKPDSKAPVKPKTQYSIVELRKLCAQMTHLPNQMPIMIVTEVIRVRSPRQKALSYVSGAGVGRTIRMTRSEAPRKRHFHERNVMKRQKQQSDGRENRACAAMSLASLHRSENRWTGFATRQVANVEVDRVMNCIRSLLNKLTREKFDTIAEKICQISFSSRELLDAFILCIMDKAMNESHFADVYADLCQELDIRTGNQIWSFIKVVSCAGASKAYTWTVRDENDALKAVEKTEEIQDCRKFTSPEEAINDAKRELGFKKILVERCQKEFQHSRHTKETNQGNAEQRIPQLAKGKQKMLGSIRFIGELFKVGLVERAAVQECFCELLGIELSKSSDSIENDGWTGLAIRVPDEEDLESLCKILSTVGKKMDCKELKPIMNLFILRILELSEDKQFSSRIRFLMKDILDLRDHMWEPRRQELQQKTLKQVRSEAEMLLRLGKNAQHGQLASSRQKSRVSSSDLAQNSKAWLVPGSAQVQLQLQDTGNHNSLPVCQEDTSNTDSQPVFDEHTSTSPVSEDYTGKIKSILKEYLSILDVEEAKTCIDELPHEDAIQTLIAEEIIQTALDCHTSQQTHLINLLSALYVRGSLHADCIQEALHRTIQILTDLQIDIPLVYQHSALICGRLILDGCFNLSWLLQTSLRELIDSETLFVETIHVLEVEMDEIAISQMLIDQQMTILDALSADQRSNESYVQKFLKDNDLMDYYVLEEIEYEDEKCYFDRTLAIKFRNFLECYLERKDLYEFDQFIRDISLECDTDVDTVGKQFLEFIISYGVRNSPLTCFEIGEMMEQSVRLEILRMSTVQCAFSHAIAAYDTSSPSFALLLARMT